MLSMSAPKRRKSVKVLLALSRSPWYMNALPRMRNTRLWPIRWSAGSSPSAARVSSIACNVLPGRSFRKARMSPNGRRISAGSCPACLI